MNLKEILFQFIGWYGIILLCVIVAYIFARFIFWRQDSAARKQNKIVEKTWAEYQILTETRWNILCQWLNGEINEKEKNKIIDPIERDLENARQAWLRAGNPGKYK